MSYSKIDCLDLDISYIQISCDKLANHIRKGTTGKKYKELLNELMQRLAKAISRNFNNSTYYVDTYPASKHLGSVIITGNGLVTFSIQIVFLNPIDKFNIISFVIKLPVFINNGKFMPPHNLLNSDRAIYVSKAYTIPNKDKKDVNIRGTTVSEDSYYNNLEEAIRACSNFYNRAVAE